MNIIAEFVVGLAILTAGICILIFPPYWIGQLYDRHTHPAEQWTYGIIIIIAVSLLATAAISLGRAILTGRS